MDGPQDGFCRLLGGVESESMIIKGNCDMHTEQPTDKTLKVINIKKISHGDK